MDDLNPLPIEVQYAGNPSCIHDCLPVVISSRYCTSLFPDDDFDSVTARNRCFCNNPYMLPLTTGKQCAWLCGRQSRADFMSFLTSPSGCGAYPPWNNITVPGPEVFEPNYSDAERWWRKWTDGQRFGIILGCVLGAWFMFFFCLGAFRRINEKLKNKYTFAPFGWKRGIPGTAT